MKEPGANNEIKQKINEMDADRVDEWIIKEGDRERKEERKNRHLWVKRFCDYVRNEEESL